jgi:hypothetical protein
VLDEKEIVRPKITDVLIFAWMNNLNVSEQPSPTKHKVLHDLTVIAPLIQTRSSREIRKRNEILEHNELDPFEIKVSFNMMLRHFVFLKICTT